MAGRRVGLEERRNTSSLHMGRRNDQCFFFLLILILLKQLELLCSVCFCCSHHLFICLIFCLFIYLFVSVLTQICKRLQNDDLCSDKVSLFILRRMKLANDVLAEQMTCQLDQSVFLANQIGGNALATDRRILRSSES